jgi:hypothetical protein
MNKILIITGSAPCVVEDIEAALLLFRSVPLCLCAFDPMLHPDFMSIGLSSVDKHLHHIKYMATYHPVQIPEIKKRREAAGGNTDYLVISHEQNPGVDILEPFIPPTGSSSHLGALAAIRIGYKKIILCGCPLTDTKYKVFQEGWSAKIKQVRVYVRSMSGWTKELLGAPTGEWLGE